MANIATTSDLSISSEEEAWELLRKLVNSEVSFAQMPRLALGDWARVRVHIPASKYDSAITPYMMQGWIELQRSIYRTSSLLQGGVGSGRDLSDDEKNRLELVVSVKSGSSDQGVELTDLLSPLVSGMVDKMSPDQILIIMLTLIVAVASASVMRHWLSERKEIKLAEIESIKTKEIISGHKAALSTIAAVSEKEMHRYDLLLKACELAPVAGDIIAEIEKGREALVKSVSKGDASVNGVKIAADAAQSITPKTRVESEEVRLDGLYKISAVDTTVVTGFRVHLFDKNGREFFGDVAEVMTTLQDRDLIRDAEWKKIPIFLQINGRVRRDKIVEATILRAREYDVSTDGAF